MIKFGFEIGPSRFRGPQLGRNFSRPNPARDLKLGWSTPLTSTPSPDSQVHDLEFYRNSVYKIKTKTKKVISSRLCPLELKNWNPDCM